MVTELCATGCAQSVVGSAVPGAGLATPQAVLPFTPSVAERSNRRNDGTSFEPCVAHSPEEIRVLGIDQATMRDAASADSQNYRGCRWELSRRPDDRPGHWRNWVSQLVGNQPPLPIYKQGHEEIRWGPDRVSGGRTIAAGTSRSDECVVVFSSGRALVVTLLTLDTETRTQTSECARAFRFAVLAASKAPR